MRHCKGSVPESGSRADHRLTREELDECRQLWLGEGINEQKIRERIEKLRRYEPMYDATRELAEDCLYPGLSRMRTFLLINLFWDQRNKPPLPAEQLRALIDQVKIHPKDLPRELR